MRFFALAAFFVLAACASTEAIIEGPYYPEGFSDGCRTAEARRAAFDARSYRNKELFELEESYRAGWRAGFADCQQTGIDGVRPTNAGETEPVI